MAKRISIEGSREHLKKSVALLWIRRGMADWVVPGSSIARRSAKTSIPLDIRFELQAAPELPPYIPERLPMAELPGLRFKVDRVPQDLVSATPPERSITYARHCGASL